MNELWILVFSMAFFFCTVIVIRVLTDRRRFSNISKGTANIETFDMIIDQFRKARKNGKFAQENMYRAKVAQAKQLISEVYQLRSEKDHLRSVIVENNKLLELAGFFCDQDCCYLTPNELNQQLSRDKIPHMCTRFGVIVLHSGHHPHIVRCTECRNNSFIDINIPGVSNINSEKEKTAHEIMSANNVIGNEVQL